MNNYIGLLFCFITGLSFLIGIFLPKFIKDEGTRHKLSIGSLALAFTVIFGLICTHLIKEISYSVQGLEMNERWLVIIGCAAIGFALLKILDRFIPHHHNHSHSELKKEEISLHVYHVSVITVIALMLHNFIESISLFGTSVYEWHHGLYLMIGVCLHNIPLGIQIGSGLSNASKKQRILMMTLLVLSGVIGPLAIMIFKINLNDFVMACLLSLTLGMLLYISLGELLKEMWEHRKDKVIYIGILIGIIVLILMEMSHTH